MKKITGILMILSMITVMMTGCSKDPDKEFDELNNTCVSLFKEKRYDEAIHASGAAIELAEGEFGPDSTKLATAYFNQACNYFMLEEYTQSRALFDRALEINLKAYGPDHHEVIRIVNYHALIAYKEGNLPKALFNYKKAADMIERTLGMNHGSLAGIYNSIGTIYNREGRYNLAEASFKRALEIKPGNQVLEKSMRILQTHKDNISKTIQDIEKEVGKQPENYVLFWRLGNLYRSSGDDDKALEKYNQALLSNPDYTAALYDAGLIYIKQGGTDKALLKFEKIENQHNEYTEASYNIARIHAKNGDKVKAIEFLKKSIDSGYNNWEEIKTDEYFGDIRGEEEYKVLIRAAGEQKEDSGNQKSS